MIGALAASRLYVLAARPGMGKTALMLQLCLHAATRGPVYVASLEMSAEDLTERALALTARIDAGLIRESWNMLPRHWEQMAAAVGEERVASPLALQQPGDGLVVAQQLEQQRLQPEVAGVVGRA